MLAVTPGDEADSQGEFRIPPTSSSTLTSHLRSVTHKTDLWPGRDREKNYVGQLALHAGSLSRTISNSPNSPALH